jgi:myo-inositol 2-dehydrogenase / D-chiro-inositol 1-dehydrogenase
VAKVVPTLVNSKYRLEIVMKSKTEKSGKLNRREFLAGAAAAAGSFMVLKPGTAFGTAANSKIKIGLVGCGGRGSWIADLFARHGGYEFTGAADYFKDRVDAFGDKFRIPASNRFTGLSCHKRLLESGVDAIAIESPPYFHPSQAAAGVDAGKHVYLAKPIAVDMPGCASVEESGRRATGRKLAFLIDFQTRANAFFIEAVKKVHDGAIGELAFGESSYHAGVPFEWMYPYIEGPSPSAEGQLRAWGLSRSLSGDIITEQNIHTLDVASWIMNAPPLFALGTGARTVRKVGEIFDHFVVHYQYPNRVGVSFTSRQFEGHGSAEGIKNRMFGSKGVLETEYGGNVMIRGENFYRGGKTPDIYEEGAVNNIAAFHKSITQGDFSNPTVSPSVQSNRVTILGRKAAYENRIVTWDEILKDEEKLAPVLAGLKD